jgi:hypothetical protein
MEVENVKPDRKGYGGEVGILTKRVNGVLHTPTLSFLCMNYIIIVKLYHR